MHVTVRNGLTLAYVIALVNALLALMDAFGLHLTANQQVAVAGFVNASVVVAARVLHLPERAPNGETVSVRHVPVLETTGGPTPEPPIVVEPVPGV